MIFLAWRSLWRNPKRTWLTISLVALTTGFMGIFQGLIDGKNNSLDQTLLILGTGHIRIIANTGIKDTSSLFAMLQKQEQVKDFAPRIEVRGLISSARNSRMCQIYGVDPRRDTGLSTLMSSVVAGQKIEAGDNRGVLLGQDLARALEVEPGDKVVIMTRDTGNQLAAASYRVKGLFSQGTGVDIVGAALTLESCQQLTGLPGPTVVSVMLHRFWDYRDVAESLETHMPGLTVETVEDFQPGVVASTKITGFISFLATILVYGIAVMGVVNSLVVSVMERKKEFGLLSALGLKSIKSLYWWEVSIMTGIGLILGLGLALLSVLALSHWGIPIPGLAEIGKEHNLAVGDRFKAALDIWHILRIAGIIGFMTIIAGFYPVSKIADLDPARAMRGL